MKLKNKLAQWGCLVVCLLGIMGCKKDPSMILLSGFDRSNGKVTNTFVPRDVYAAQNEKMMNAVVDDTFAALQQVDDQAEAGKKNSRWHLDKVVVGFGVSSAFGVGKTVDMEVESGIEFAFKKIKE